MGGLGSLRPGLKRRVGECVFRTVIEAVPTRFGVSTRRASQYWPEGRRSQDAGASKSIHSRSKQPYVARSLGI